MRQSFLTLFISLYATFAMAAQATYQFNLPEQPLAETLKAIGQQTATNILFDPGTVVNRRAPALRATLTASEAIERVLAGSDLSAKQSADAVLIRVSGNETAAIGEGATASGNYGGAVQVAQTEAAAASGQSAEESSGADSQGDPGTEKLDEIVVTARKRAERLKDVPMSITAISGEKLENSGIDNSRDLGIATPGLVIGEAGLMNISIRGVTTALQGVTTDPSTAFYLDGVYQPRFESSLVELMDIKRVEVLKGPQVVLYGRNATAGAIHFVSNDPGSEFGGSLKLGFGNFGAVQSSAALNIPVVNDRLLLRVSAMDLKSDGYMKNVVNITDRPARTDIRAGRLALKYLATDDLAITFRGSISDNRAITTPLKALNPTALGSAYDLSGDPYQVSSDQLTSQPYKNTGASMTVDWDTSWGKLTSISAYTKSSFGPLNYDVDTVESTIINVGVKGRPDIGLFQDSKLVSQEVYLADTAGALDWLVGTVYMHEDGKYGGADEFSPGNAVFFPAQNETSAYAAYAQLAYSITPSLKLSAGLRYSDENKTAGRALGSPAPQPLQYDEGSWNAWTPSATASYRLSADNMLYTTFSKGFKSGGFDPGSLQPALNPEKIESVEIGSKNEWLNGKLGLEVSLYRYQYTDLQVQIFLTPTQSAWENAGAAKGKGIEIAVNTAPTDRLKIDAGVSLMDAKYDSFESVSGNLGGNQPPYSPKWTVNLGAAYEAPLGTWGAATFRMDYYRSARRYFTAANRPELSQDGYGLLNGRVTIASSHAGPWVAAYAKNITDELIYSFGLDLGPSLVLAPTAPRTYGIELGYDF